MKKFLSIILSLAMIFTLSITAFAAAPSENQLSQISDGFGIPMDVLADLDSETIMNTLSKLRIFENQEKVPLQNLNSVFLIIHTTPMTLLFSV